MNPPTQTGAPTKKKGNGVTTPSRRGGSGRVLTDVIVDLGFVEQGVVDEAVARAEDAGALPERLLLKDGTITDDQLARAVAERFGLDHIDLGVYRVDPDAAKLVTPAAARRYQAVPVSFAGERTLLVAMSDPANVLAQDDIGVMTGYEVRPAVASAAGIDKLLERLEDPDFGNGASAPLEDDGEVAEPHRPEPSAPAGPMYDFKEQAPINFGASGEDSSVIQLVHRVIKEAVERGSSDIHFEPGDEDMRVRYRIDGVLQRGGRRPRQRRARRRLAREDPLRPRHRRAPRAAGRPHLARGRRQADRPPCRDAAVRVRRERRHANPGPVARS